KGIESGLLQILDLAANPENAALVQDMMIRSGLAHTVDPNDPENRDKWMWNGAVEDANRNGVIPQSELRKYGMVHLGGVRFSPASIEQARRLEEIALKVSAREDRQPEINENGEAVTTYCNFAFQDILTESNLIDASVLTKITTAGTDDIAGKANGMGGYFKGNYRTIDGLTAQYLANMGIPVALSYINPDNTQAGHIAVVTANYGTYIPALGPRITQAGVKNGQYWARDPQTFGGRSVRPYSSYYALDKTANLSPFKSRGVLPIPRTRGGR
ncbi:MAG: hypothetical protein LBU28_00895, partial [Spirochaetaceae bacterium]|nr:hypothetical protein [Spirochaetaceae bacterium]